MTNATMLITEKHRFRRLLIGLSVVIALSFLTLGVSFYGLLFAQLRVMTQRSVEQLLEKHGESLALEVFLQRTGAYKLRVDEVARDGGGLAADFGICIYRPASGEILISTVSGCVPNEVAPGAYLRAGGYTEVVRPLESGLSEEHVLVKATYRDSGTFLGAVRAHPWIPFLASALLVSMILLVTKTLDRYHRTILAKASAIEKENHTNKAIALTTKMLAHDLRRPFSMLEGMLGLVETAKDPARLQVVATTYLPDVRRAMKKINRLIDEVLWIGSESALKAEPTSAESLIETSLYEVFRVFPRAAVSFHYDLRHTRKVTVDSIKALRVFENLLANAVQAMQGKGTIAFTTEDVELARRRFVRFSIRNSGTMIPKDDLEQLFDPFFTRGKRGGTGLGLAICKQIVAQHGGEIVVHSTEEIGTEFVFTLPAGAKYMVSSDTSLPATSAEMNPLRSGAESEPLASDVDRDAIRVADAVQCLQRRLRVLVVDDEVVYRNILKQQIMGDPYLAESIELLEADTGVVAVEMASSSAPDVIIMDVDFGAGEDDGYSAVSELRRRGSKAIICMHSNRSAEGESGSQEIKDADLFLPKPIRRSGLLRTLAMVAQPART